VSVSDDDVETPRAMRVLEKNPAIRRAALAFAIGAVAWFTISFFVLHGFIVEPAYLAIVAASLHLTSERMNALPRRRAAQVRVTREGVFVDGALAVARERIADGWFQPRPAREGATGSTLRLLGKDRSILFEAEMTEPLASSALRVLGLDLGSKRAEVVGPSPLVATQARAVAAALVAAFLLSVVAMILGFFGIRNIPLTALLTIAPFVVAMAPSRIAVGVDGILVRWLWRERFFPAVRIDRVVRGREGGGDDGENALTIVLRDGSRATIHASLPRFSRRDDVLARNPRLVREALLRRIEAALAAFRAGASGPDVSALVRRGTRTSREWLEALGRLRSSDEGGYRDTIVRDEDLFRIVEDPSAPEDARAGAATALRRSLDAEGRARVRVAASTTASPGLRVVLDAAAGEDDAALAAALEGIVEKRGMRAGD
jgi:hypothetical protein